MLYFENEITQIMTKEIAKRVNRLLRGDADIAADAKELERIRHCMEFAEEITAQLIRADMDEEEARNNAAQKEDANGTDS